VLGGKSGLPPILFTAGDYKIERPFVTLVKKGNINFQIYITLNIVFPAVNETGKVQANSLPWQHERCEQ